MIARALILRPLLREKLRTGATILGIAIGVAVIVAIQLANQSALRAFRESIDAVAGRANYQVASDAGLLDENVLFALQPFWRDRIRFAPVIDIEGVAEPAQIPMRLLAVDLLSDLHFRDYRYAEISVEAKQYFGLFSPDSIVVPAPFAREHGLKLGSPLTLNILGHRKTMFVRGILEARGPATAFNGAIAVCDIATAQRAFGLEGRLSRVDLLVPNETVVPRIARVLPAGTRIERPSRRNERVERMLRAFRVNLFALAGVALLVGMFLVYNTVLISILRRRRDVGILKTLGAAPSRIFASFLGEGLVFGLLGAVLGIALGQVLASGILRAVARTINTLYVTSAPEAVTLTPGVIAVGTLVGVVLSVLAAVQPSLEAARTRPLAMLNVRQPLRLSGRRTRPFRPPDNLERLSYICFIAAVLISRIPPIHGIAIAGYVSVLFVVAGFSLLAPNIIRVTTRLASAPLQKTFGIVGRLAAASLPANLRRTSVASAALSLATGMMVAVALMVGSFRETVRIWVDQTVSSDLWLRPSKGLSNAQVALFPPTITDELQKIPFIAAFDRVRGKDILYGDTLINVGSGDFAVAARFGDLPMLSPRSANNALLGALRQKGVVVSEPFSVKFKKGAGDTVDLPTAHGVRRFPITGVYRDYSNDRGVVVMDRSLFVESFDDDRINTVVLYLKPGVSKDVARRQLERMLGPKYHAFTVSNGEVRAEVMKIFDQTFLITYALLGVAIIVGVLGIINTLGALILERTRELALLRVSGVTTGEVRTMLVLESSLLGLASTATGLVMGYALSWILIFVINKQSFGWTIEFHTPAALIASSLAVVFLASAVAGLVPARLANRIDVAAAIKSE